jgi:site-specific recombinase XerD
LTRDIRLRVHGKGKSRVFVPMLAALPWFDNLWEFWIKAMGREPGDDDPVFATPTGKRLGSVKKSLSELLKTAELLADHRGARRTAYSFRHFYISQQLIAGVDVFLLAKNTGTSSDMIKPFYGQVRLERMAKELRPEWRDRGQGG